MNYSWKESDTCELVSVDVRQVGNSYYLVKKEDNSVLSTSKAGARTVELLRRKNNLTEVKNILSNEFHVGVDEINVSPIIEILLANGYIYRMGQHRYSSKKNVIVTNVKYYYRLAINLLTNYLLHLDHVNFTYKILKYVFMKSIIIDDLIIQQTRASLEKVQVNKTDVLNNFILNQKQRMFDKTLFFFLSDRAFKTWIMEYFIIENSEQLSMLQNRQIIFCAFHFANYEMLPIVLGAHGIEVYTPIAFKDELFKKHTNRIEEVKERIFPVVPRIYSRTNKDGIILFRALKNNKNILLYCDTHILLTDIYAKVKMFGHEVKVSRGAGVLHKKTGIPIVPILTHLKNDKCFIKIMPEIKIMDGEGEQKIMQELMMILERHIKNYPSQWAKWPDFESMMDR